MNNCEHFATWAKIDEETSEQSKVNLELNTRHFLSYSCPLPPMNQAGIIDNLMPIVEIFGKLWEAFTEQHLEVHIIK